MAELYQRLKEMGSNIMGSFAGPVQQAAPSLATTQGSTSMLGTARETPGYTSAGGRRYGKTRRHRKGRKSLRRRRYVSSLKFDQPPRGHFPYNPSIRFSISLATSCF